MNNHQFVTNYYLFFINKWFDRCVFGRVISAVNDDLCSTDGSVDYMRIRTSNGMVDNAWTPRVSRAECRATQPKSKRNSVARDSNGLRAHDGVGVREIYCVCYFDSKCVAWSLCVRARFAACRPIRKLRLSIERKTTI